MPSLRERVDDHKPRRISQKEWQQYAIAKSRLRTSRESVEDGKDQENPAGTLGPVHVHPVDEYEHHEEEPVKFYPAYCHSKSPTWHQWCRFTCNDIHVALRPPPSNYRVQHSLAPAYHGGKSYGAQNEPVVLYFLNHPVQFVQIVGVVVLYNENFEKFWLFTIDDGSGNTVDVVCQKPKGVGQPFPQNDRQLLAAEKQETYQCDADAAQCEEEHEISELSAQVERDIQLGTVVQVKGTITNFRRSRPKNIQTVEQSNAARSVVIHNSYSTSHNIRHSRSNLGFPLESAPPLIVDTEDKSTRQLILHRLKSVPSTTHELALIAARTLFHETVLSKPWRLTAQQIKSCYVEAAGENGKKNRLAKKVNLRQESSEKREEDEHQRILTEYASEEREREKDAERVRRAAELLEQQSAMGASGEAKKSNVKQLVRTKSSNLDEPEETEDIRRSLRKVEETPVLLDTAPLAGFESMLSIDMDEKSALLRAAFG